MAEKAIRLGGEATADNGDQRVAQRVEKIFAIPGVGSLLVTAIQSNDYNVVISLSFIYSAMYIGIMLVVDLLYGIIDPRIRLAKGDD